MIDESKLRPFDLEAAKRGERVVRNLEGVWKEVIAGAWERDWIRCYCCLILDAEGDRVWLITSDADLRMAPKTKTAWYALVRLPEGATAIFYDDSEADLHAYCRRHDLTILATHSIEVEE